MPLTPTPNYNLPRVAPEDPVDDNQAFNAAMALLDSALAAVAAGGGGGGTGLPPGWVNMQTAAGTAADPAVPMNAAIAAAPAHSVIYFPPGFAPVIKTPLVFPGQRTYMGPGNSLGGGCTIKAAPDFVGTSLIGTASWWNNATVCDNPMRIQGLQLDCSGLAITGLTMIAFWSRIHDVQVVNSGAGGHGIRLTDRTRNNTNIVTNSCSENTIFECRFQQLGGSGVYQESNNGFSNQDGRVKDCFFMDCLGYGISLARAAGWYVEGNHMYGIGLDGIAAARCYATTVSRNYIEDFGLENINTGYYSGIGMECLDTRASVCEGNTVSCTQPSPPVGQRWTNFWIGGGSGQLRANCVLTGNTATCSRDTAPSVTRTVAYRLGEDFYTESRQLRVEWSGNQVEDRPAGWWQARRQVFLGVRVREAALVTRSGQGSGAPTAGIAVDYSQANPNGTTAT